jgi:hypothetical protein
MKKKIIFGYESVISVKEVDSSFNNTMIIASIGHIPSYILCKEKDTYFWLRLDGLTKFLSGYKEISNAISDIVRKFDANVYLDDNDLSYWLCH